MPSSLLALATMLANPLPPACPASCGQADTVVLHPQDQVLAPAATVTWTVVAWAWWATFDKASRSTARRWSPTLLLMMVSTGPSKRTVGSKPNAARSSAHTSRIMARQDWVAGVMVN